ncbi:hypothetical protein HI914_04798 [Erysiphe necator]|nr:hypothetical protein HI914_04798 [Erysiphe necator]
MTGASRKKTYSRRVATVSGEPANKKRCIGRITTAYLGSQYESSTQEKNSLEDSSPKFGYDIRKFLLPISSASISLNHETASRSISLSGSQTKRKKRRLRLNVSEAREISAKPTENHISSPRLIQQTIASSGKELVNCKTCGMVYAFWEEKQHNLYHQKLNLEFMPVIRCKKATIYEQEFENSSLCIQVLDRYIEKNLRSLGEKAIQLSSSNGLEMEHIESNSLWGLIPNPHNNSDHDQVLHYKLYVMFYGPQLVALLLAERIGYAEVFDYTEYDSLEYKTEISREKQISDNKNNYRKVFMSIERLWVHKNFQRKGLASMIINEARKNFLYPIVLSKNELAISWPTDDGDKFFRRYFNQNSSLAPYLINVADTTRLKSHKNISPKLSSE